MLDANYSGNPGTENAMQDATPDTARAGRLGRVLRSPKTFWWGFGILVVLQVLLCFQGLGDQWTRGHNGFNGSAYHLAARNSVRWDVLFPVQYYTGRTPPTPADFYTHHPLAMHLHNVASFRVFGDTEASIRLVPAIHSVLALIALMLFVRRFWGHETGPGSTPAPSGDRSAIRSTPPSASGGMAALLAGAIYFALPINGIYANMQNHPAGCIFWSLIAFTCYLHLQAERERLRAGEARAPWMRWLIGLFLATFMATAWEWPAYYLAAFTAIHWGLRALGRQLRTGRSWWRLGGDLGLLFAYGVWVLALAAGHFLLVHVVVGDLGELGGTIASRLNIPWDRFMFTVKVVPALMFTWPILALAAVGFLRIVVRMIRGRFQDRDLVPLSFAIAGVVHFIIFKWSSIVHEYWLWTTLPFVSIVSATLLLDASCWIRRTAPRFLSRLGRPALEARLAWAASLAVFLILVPLVVRSVDLVPRGKSVGGSMWFVAPTRPGTMDAYDSGRPELRFADQVRTWTDRSTGVLMHPAMQTMRPESRFDTTLDREFLEMKPRRVDDLAGPQRLGITGWVYIAPVSAITKADRAELASRHPWLQFGDYVMVDLRSDASRIEVWRLEEQPSDLVWWYWYSAFEPRVVPVRDEAAEAVLAEAVGRVRAAASAPAKPGEQP